MKIAVTSLGLSLGMKLVSAFAVASWIGFAKATQGLTPSSVYARLTGS